MIKVVEKPWGQESWFAYNEKYAGKIIDINKGCRLSEQYHNKKLETLYLISGKSHIYIEEHHGNITTKVKTLEPGDSITINPGTIHRIVALTECKFVEVSTPELDDLVRLDDDYGRV